MIKDVRLPDNRITFAKLPKKEQEAESIILPNTINNRLNQKYDKSMSAIIEYPAKGLKGDVNSDFYEFLSMGMIPYVIGSAMFIGLFNLVNKHLAPHSKFFASDKGKKMGLGVILYGLGKTLSQDLVTRPVNWATGVDIELPYRNVYYPLPTKPGAAAEIIPQHQQRKVYDSREFFRKDLLAKDPNYGVAYYDKIAKKVGLGENLKDSVSETTPIIQNIISTTKTAKILTSYAWAALGVGIALQSCWSDFFDAVSKRAKYVKAPQDSFLKRIVTKMSNMTKNIINVSASFGKTLVKALGSLWKGKPGTKGYMKHAGKAWVLTTLALTAGSTVNVIQRAKNMAKRSNKNLFDETQESMVI